MMCPYRNFKECDWNNCAARMYIKSLARSYEVMRVCALAYNGAPLPQADFTKTYEDSDHDQK